MILITLFMSLKIHKVISLDKDTFMITIPKSLNSSESKIFKATNKFNELEFLYEFYEPFTVIKNNNKVYIFDQDLVLVFGPDDEMSSFFIKNYSSINIAPVFTSDHIYYVGKDPDYGTQVFRMPLSQIAKGIWKEPKKKEIYVYPNPVSNKIFIKYHYFYLNKEYLIISSNGQIIQKGILESNFIETSDLPIGLYFLRIVDGDEVFSTKFV